MSPAEEVRQRCGTVYTWNCAGELYGIECELCEERPFCALNEFAEHMELWHSDWQQAPEDELMLEVLAEQSSGGEVNELKQQLVQELNALDAQPPTTPTSLPLPLPSHHEQQHEEQLEQQPPPLMDTLCLVDHIKFDADVSISPPCSPLSLYLSHSMCIGPVKTQSINQGKQPNKKKQKQLKK